MYYLSVFCVLVTCFSLSRTQTDNVTTSAPDVVTSGGNSDCLASDNNCTTGTCQIQNGKQQCVCGTYAYGTLCEYINVRLLAYSVGSDSITFTWPSPPGLVGFYSAHYNPSRTPPVLSIQDLNMTTGATSVRIGELESDDVYNIVCVVSNKTLGDRNQTVLIKSILTLDAGSYCVNVLTAYDGFGPWALSAFGIGIAMASLVFILMFGKCVANCIQREKRDQMMADVLGRLHLNVLIKKPSYNPQNDDTLTNSGVDNPAADISPHNVNRV